MQSCESEPIHLPGSVQPYGALLVTRPDLTITHVSANVQHWLGLPAADCLHKTLFDLIDDRSCEAVCALLRATSRGPQGLIPNAITRQPPDRSVDLSVSRLDDVCFVEVEEASGHEGLELARTPASVASFFARLQQSAQRMVASASCQALCEVLCTEVRQLFGYDRVLAYQFDPHWHGNVIAEARNEVFPSYLGHKFPEGDIPKQARHMFLDNMLRMICDAKAQMVPLEGKIPKAVDLTFCQLRAPSPVHLEYMINMQTCASLTLSLRTETNLWGLIACHHATPRHLTARLRNAAELLVRLASSLLVQRQRQDGEALRRHLAHINTQLNHSMRSHTHLLSALCDGPTAIDALNHTGGGCAVRLGGQWKTLGATPPAWAYQRISRWLEERPEKKDIFVTDHLAQSFPEMAPHSAKASGLMAMSLPQSAGDCVLWFLPELPRETTWAGNPHDHVHTTEGPEGSLLHPRKSFQQYKQTVVHHSRSIAPEELQALRTLRKNITEVDLANKVESERRLRQVAEQERLRAEQATRLREHVLNIVSHDLRNPLSSVELSTQLARRRLHRRQEMPGVDEYQHMLTKVDTACLRMRRLIEDILSLSKMQGGQWQMERTVVSGQTILSETQTLLESAAEAQKLRLAIEAPADPVPCFGDAERLIQAIGNLVGNALKFTPEGGTITLSVSPSHRHQAALFCVRDTGRGIAKEDQAHIFDAFWQADGREKKKGVGLGLSIVKQIVDAHGGDLWVESEPGQGTGFWFTCPQGEPAPEACSPPHS